MDWSLKIPPAPLSLPLKGKYVVFSDLHRDKYRSKAGDFWENSDLYEEALRYYYNKKYTLIENGDGEELWQFSLKEIVTSHPAIYSLISDFYKDNKFYAVFGNHNVDMKFRIFHRYWTDKFAPGIKYQPLIFIGDHILITHGHQWDLVYRLGFIPVRLVVGFWKYMEYLGFSSFDPSIPAANPDEGRKIDKRIIKWGKDYGYIMICGHTHRAKFMPGGEYYFNSGCGVVTDRLTGLEIDNGEIKLIRWLLWEDGKFRRQVLETTALPQSREDLKTRLRKERINGDKGKVLTIFGSSRAEKGSKEYDQAYKLGQLAAEKGFIIKNGGYGGTMEASAKGAIDAGGKAIGITITDSEWGKGNRFVTKEIQTEDLFNRLKNLFLGSDAIIVLPGSTGTQLELMMAIEMLYKGLIKKLPLVILGGYWENIVEETNKLSPGVEDYILHASSPEEAIMLLDKSDEIYEK